MKNLFHVNNKLYRMLKVKQNHRNHHKNKKLQTKTIIRNKLMRNKKRRKNKLKRWKKM